MLQYYLKDAGVNMSWVGTGRLYFHSNGKMQITTASSRGCSRHAKPCTKEDGGLENQQRKVSRLLYLWRYLVPSASKCSRQLACEAEASHASKCSRQLA